MHMSLVVVVVALVAIAMASPPSGRYSTRYDNLDVDGILKNERALGAYVKCLLDQGPCSPEGREFRSNLPDALETHCSKCSDAQKTMIKKIANYMIAHRQDQWKLIKDKYDPKGLHHESFAKFLSSPA